MRRLVATLAFALGCGEALPSPSLVNAPRFIALTTETPELRPGDPVSVRAVFFDPLMREARFRGWWCWERAGVDPLGCEEVGADGALRFDGSEGHIGAGSLRAPKEGVTRALVIVEAAVDDELVTAFRRLAVLDEGPLWRPPTLRRVALREGSREVELIEGQTILLPEGDAPRRLIVEFEGDEAMTASFLTTDGSFSPPRGYGRSPIEVGWQAGATAERLVWVVLRDDRGGSRVRSFVARRPR